MKTKKQIIADAHDAVLTMIKRELHSTKLALITNKNKINVLADEQRKLKKVRLELNTLLHTMNAGSYRTITK